MRQVTSAQGEQLAREYDMKFFETSARSGQNVSEAFVTLATDVKERLLKGGGGAPSEGINLGQAKAAPAKKGCC